jgi:uncharacterized small protein (DUF1192 family)
MASDDLSRLGRDQLEGFIGKLRAEAAELKAERDRLLDERAYLSARYSEVAAEHDRLKEANGIWERAAALHQETLRHAYNYGAEQRAFRQDAEADAQRAWKRVKLLERRCERIGRIAAGHDDE